MNKCGLLTKCCAVLIYNFDIDGPRKHKRLACRESVKRNPQVLDPASKRVYLDGGHEGWWWYSMVWCTEQRRKPKRKPTRTDGRYGMVWYGMVWYGMVEVYEGAPVAVSGWVLTDRHDLAPCAANSLHRVTMSGKNIIGGTGTLGIA